MAQRRRRTKTGNSELSARPYGLWDAKRKAYLRWRFYKHVKHAHDGAHCEARWAPVGTSIEVCNRDYGTVLNTYTHKVKGQIIFDEGDK